MKTVASSFFRYRKIGFLALALVFALLGAIYTSAYPVSLIFSIISLICMGFFFRRIVLYSLVCIGIGAFSYAYHHNYFLSVISRMAQLHLFSAGIPLSPDTDLSDITSIAIECNNISIAFDPSSDTVRIHSRMQHRVANGTLSLTCPDNHKFHYDLVIGTNHVYEKIDVTSSHLRLFGSFSHPARQMKITGEAIQIDASLMSTSFFLEGKDLSLSGAITASAAVIRGSAISAEMDVQTPSLTIEGENITFELDLKETDDVSVKGSHIVGKCTYLDEWDNERTVSASGEQVKIDVYLPAKIPGTLKTEGLITVIRY